MVKVKVKLLESNGLGYFKNSIHDLIQSNPLLPLPPPLPITTTLTLRLAAQTWVVSMFVLIKINISLT